MTPLTDAQRWGLIFKAGRTERLFLSQADFAARIVELAAEAGVDVTVDQSTVSRWETGECAPSLRTRPFVARALEIDPSVLFQKVAA